MPNFLPRLRQVLVATIVLLAFPVSAHEPPTGLLIHLPFEGNLHSIGRAAVLGQKISSNPANAGGAFNYGPGYPGQAAFFDGESAVRIPFDLHPDFYPQLTVTMWIKVGRGFGSGYLFSTGAPSGAKLRYSGTQLTALGPRVETRIRDKVPLDEWVLIAGVWDHEAGSVAVFANGEMTAVGFNAGAPRDHNFARPDFWIGTYDDGAGSTNTVSGIHIDDVRIYDRALSKEDLFGMAIGPAIEEEPQLGEPPLPPEEEGDKHEPPFETTTEPGLESEMHRDRSEPSVTGTRPGEDPTLDKLRRTQAPGTPPSDDAVRDAIGDGYDPGPTTDWEQVQEEARKPGVDDEELDRLRRSEAGTVNPGGDRAADAVRDQINRDELPESTDFETRRQGLEGDMDPVSGQGKPGVAGTLHVTPMKDGELYVRVKSGEPTHSPWSANLAWHKGNHLLTVDLVEHAIHTIEWFERADQPCKIVVYGYAPGTNQFGGPNTASFGRDVCDPKANERSSKVASILSDGAAIVGLKIGKAAAPGGSILEAMKGVEISGNRLTPDGSLSSDEAWDTATRTNCCGAGLNWGSWKEFVNCPSGFVATGVRAKYSESSYAKPQVTDMALICREVED